MRKFLLPEGGCRYKANLHCHTTLSDGHLTPEEVKAAYSAKGYSVVAFTDHDSFLPQHARLSDESFLALNGYEVAFTEAEEQPGRNMCRACHLCLIAKEPDNLRQVCWYHSKHFDRHTSVVQTEDAPEFDNAYTPEQINELIRRARSAGFYVTYNHPTWSREDYTRYCAYHGMDAMEIGNYDALTQGLPEYNDRVYDDMLIGGERIGCIATDDNHNKHPGTGNWDSFGCWTMIGAERLDYRSVTAALEAGAYYATEGPEINELTFEDGKLRIRTSPAERICFSTGRRHSAFCANADGSPVTEAEFEPFERDIFIRVTVIDHRGKSAWTRAYFLDELL